MKIVVDFEHHEQKSIETKKALSAVYSVVHWANRSIYKKCFEKIYVVVHDTPINDYAFVNADPYTKKVFVSLNLYSIIDEYKNNPEYRQVFFKKDTEDIDLLTYISFYFLHELGHIVHASFLFAGKNNLYNKMEKYILKFKPYFLTIDNEKDFFKRQKLYRKIPSENFADNFALKNLVFIKKPLV